MDGLTRENLDHHCRTCLARLVNSDSEGRYLCGIIAKSKPLIDWINKFASINVRNDWHAYPKLLCYQCYDIFKDLNSFQQLVWSTEKTLREIREKYKNIHINTREKNELNGKVCKVPTGPYETSTSPYKASGTIHKNNNNCLRRIKENEIQMKLVDPEFNKPYVDHCTQSFDQVEEIVIKTEVLDDDFDKNNSAIKSESNIIESFQTESNLLNTEMTAKSNIDADVIIKQEIFDDDGNNTNPEELSAIKKSNLQQPALDPSYKIEESVNESKKLLIDFQDYTMEESDNLEEESSNNKFKIESAETISLTDFELDFIGDLERSNDTDSVDLWDEYECKHCQLFYDNKYTCMAHKRIYHGTGVKKRKGYKCEICPKAYLSFVYFDRHMREVHKIFVRPYRCEYAKCNFRFESWTKRSQHYHEYHQQPKATRLTASFDVLKFEKDLFICLVCNKQYKSLNYIKFHMPTHGEDVKLRCGICGVEHSTQRKLNNHYDKCHDQNYKNINLCKICKKVFENKDQINKHILREHKRIYVCEHCPRRFRTPHGLSFHQPFHSKTMPLTCDKCCKTYSTCYKYKCHMRYVHKLEFHYEDPEL